MRVRHKRRRRKKAVARAARVSIAQILSWADSHFARTGRWPQRDSGRVCGGIGIKWSNIDAALRYGLRGLEGKSSLPQLLAERRGVRNRKRLTHLTVSGILSWADCFFRRQGKWPTHESGPIIEAPGETWNAVEIALSVGLRGLPGGASLARLLARHRGARNRMQVPPLSHEQILTWADAFHRRTGKWPTSQVGSIEDAPGESWTAIQIAMQHGRRGLPKLTLGKLLEMKRGVRNNKNLPRLSYRCILLWGDAHFARHGTWPGVASGPIQDAPGETWGAINTAMQAGSRGLPAQYSLAQLLSDRRGVRNSHRLPKLTTRQILTWARQFRKRHGHWPNKQSGPIPDAGNGETWKSVISALYYGYRGLGGRQTLNSLLKTSTVQPN